MLAARSTLVIVLYVGISTTGYASMVVHRGESAALHCPGGVWERPYQSYWYKQEYDGTTPASTALIASYVSSSGSVQLDPDYSERGVTLSTFDGHLFFPMIALSDEGGYTCSFSPGNYHGIELAVHVRPSGLSLSAPEMPVKLNDTLTVICTVDEIRPAPADFYWELDGRKLPGGIQRYIVDTSYNVLRLTNTLTHVVKAEDKGRMLACVVSYEGTEFRNTIVLDVLLCMTITPGAGPDVTAIVLGLLLAIFVCGFVASTIFILHQRKRIMAMGNKLEKLGSQTRGAATSGTSHGKEGPTTAGKVTRKESPSTTGIVTRNEGPKTTGKVTRREGPTTSGKGTRREGPTTNEKVTSGRGTRRAGPTTAEKVTSGKGIRREGPTTTEKVTSGKGTRREGPTTSEKVTRKEGPATAGKVTRREGHSTTGRVTRSEDPSTIVRVTKKDSSSTTERVTGKQRSTSLEGAAVKGPGTVKNVPVNKGRTAHTGSKSGSGTASKKDSPPPTGAHYETIEGDEYGDVMTQARYEKVIPTDDTHPQDEISHYVNIENHPYEEVKY